MEFLKNLFSKPIPAPLKFEPLLPMQGDLVKPTSVHVSISNDLQISQHFTYGMLVSTDNRNFMDKNFELGKQYIDNMKRLCNEVLEPVVLLVGVVPHINSCFRCADLNSSVGGSKTSQHVEAEAADTTYAGKNLKDVFNIISTSKIPYGQLIYEFGRWVHVSIIDQVLHPGKISQEFVATYVDGKTVYTPTTKILV